MRIAYIAYPTSLLLASAKLGGAKQALSLNVERLPR